jgi:phosphoribosylformylglycinamidine cyclo-ligase
MGHRLEIFTNESAAQQMINAAKHFNIDAKVIGRVETSDKKTLILKVKDKQIIY